MGRPGRVGPAQLFSRQGCNLRSVRSLDTEAYGGAWALDMSKETVVAIVGDGDDIFIVVDGVKIAKRQAKTWVSLEPGWRVLDGWLTLAEAAARQGVSKADMRKAIKSGEAYAAKDEHGVLRVSSLVIEHNAVRVH